MATETNSAEAVSAPGMPQLDFSTWGNQIFWLVLALIAIYLILSRVEVVVSCGKAPRCLP